MTYQEFKTRYPVRLNAQQEAAVRQTEGPVLLLAVPGSGKTTVLVTRLGYMLYCRGIRPERILTVTYTVAAARDMRARFVSFFGEKGVERLTFRTINSLCTAIIGYYARQKKTEAFDLLNDERRIKGVLRDLLVRTGIPFPNDLQITEARTHITFCKNMMLSEADIHAHTVEGMDFPRIYFEYQDYLRRSRLMDYDDQMVFAHRILRQFPDILEHFQRRWSYLCVDEAQDTSKIQHAILRLLAARERNIFMVGDEDQSIYGFRAAWPQALLEFERVFPGAQVLKLETNYRSTRTIVDRADAFIRRNQNRRPKTMRTDNLEGPPVRKVVLKDYSRQYNYLLKIAENCTEPTAVLYRNNDSALPLIDLLERKGVPFACRQREATFFSAPSVRDIVDMLEFAFDDGNRERFLRFYYKLDLKVKKAVITPLLYGMGEDETVLQRLLDSGTLEPWQEGKVKSLQTHFAKFPSLTSFAAIERLVRFMGYGDYLREQRADTSRLDILRALANQTPNLGAFLLRLQELKELAEAGSQETCPFVLSTIHASKGLEYERVIVIDAVDGILPSVALTAQGEALDSEDAGALEEERRLFYVAATRAKQKLEFLCYEGKFGEASESRNTFISQFLGEASRRQAVPPPQPPKSAPVKPAGPAPEQIEAWMKDYIPGVEVTHKLFGRGLVTGRDGDFAVIAFRENGVKKVSLPVCLQQEKIWLTHFV